MVKMKVRGKQDGLLEVLFSGLMGGVILSLIFSLTTSTQIKFFILVGFALIGILIGYAFWRSLRQWR